MAPGTAKGRPKIAVKSRMPPRPKINIKCVDSDEEVSRRHSGEKKREKKISVYEQPFDPNPTGDAFEERRDELEQDISWLEDLLSQKTGHMPDSQEYEDLKAMLEEGSLHESFRQTPIRVSDFTSAFESADENRFTLEERSFHAPPSLAHRRYLKSISESPKLQKAVAKPRMRPAKKLIVEKIWDKALKMLKPPRRQIDDDEDEEEFE